MGEWVAGGRGVPRRGGPAGGMGRRPPAACLRVAQQETPAGSASLPHDVSGSALARPPDRPSAPSSHDNARLHPPSSRHPPPPATMHPLPRSLHAPPLQPTPTRRCWCFYSSSSCSTLHVICLFICLPLPLSLSLIIPVNKRTL